MSTSLFGSNVIARMRSCYLSQIGRLISYAQAADRKEFGLNPGQTNIRTSEDIQAMEPKLQHETDELGQDIQNSVRQHVFLHFSSTPAAFCTVLYMTLHRKTP